MKLSRLQKGKSGAPASTASSTRRQPAAPTKVVEYASSLTATNYYLKIGLSRSEVRLVKRLSRDYGFRKEPCARMARQLVMMALVNLPIIEQSFTALVKYCDSEDIHIETLLERRAQQVLDSLLKAPK